MSTSSIDMARGCRLPLLAMIALLGACASKTGLEGLDGERGAVSKYAEEREGEAAAASDAVHIPPVPHDPAVEAGAREAIPEYIRGIQMMQAGELDKALVLFQSLSSRYPKLSGPHVNQGLVLLQQTKYEDAESALRTALEVNRRNPYAWNALGLTLREQGRFDEARQAYQQALTLDPLYARAHFNLAVLAELYLRDLNLALTHFRSYQTLQKNTDRTVTNWIKDLERRAPAPAPAQVAPAPAAAPTQEVN